VFDDGTVSEIVRNLGNPAPLKFAAGRTIINAGDKGVTMYVVREGRVTIIAEGKTIERVGVGGVFGEMALVDRATRAASAVAETDCAVNAVNRKRFLDLVQRDPAFGLSLLKVLGQRLQAVTV
jgi:CRP-like cAMP-binding protein